MSYLPPPGQGPYSGGPDPYPTGPGGAPPPGPPADPGGGYPGMPGAPPGQGGYQPAPGYGEQSPWGQDGPASGPPTSGPGGMPVSGPPPGPFQDPSGMYQPPPVGGYPAGPAGYSPVPPRKGLSGGIIALIAVGVVVVLGLGVTGVAYMVHRTSSPAGDAVPAANAASSSSAANEESSSSSPSPSPTARDPSTLDDESTDETPFDERQFFPGSVGSYSLAAEDRFSGCTDVGGSKTEKLMRKHGCDQMATGSYLDEEHGLMASTMVIPLPTADDARAVNDTFADGGEAFTTLHFFCPKSGPGSSLCDEAAGLRWRGWFTNYHRYVLVAVIVQTDGTDTTANTAGASSLANDVLDAVEEQMLEIRD